MAKIHPEGKAKVMPSITVFCAFTRLEMVHRWFNDLESTDLAPETTSLAFIIDCNEPKIYKRLIDRINDSGFSRYLILRNYDHEVAAAHIPRRRQRIAEIHEQSKSLIANFGNEWVLGLEDDTVFTDLNVSRWWLKARADQVGLVSGYQAGRWHNKIIGVWDTDDPNNPTEAWTMLPGKDFEEIDAVGFYGYLTRAQYYLEHNYHTELYEPWGPDVNYGLYLRRMGLKNYVDWTQPLGHFDQGTIITPDHDLHADHFYINKSSEYETQTPQWVRRRQDV